MIEEIIELLANQRLTKVATDTGLPYQWLRRLQKGETKNPRLDRLEKLHTYLKKLQ